MDAREWVSVSFKASNCNYNKLSQLKQKAIITQKLAVIPAIAEMLCVMMYCLLLINQQMRLSIWTENKDAEF